MKTIIRLSIALVLCVPVCGAFAQTGLMPIGVCDLPEPGTYVTRTCAHSAYVHEILGHTGLGYSRIAVDKIPEALPSLRILVVIGTGDLPGAARNAMDTWIRDGGTLISVGTTCGAPDWFGVAVEHPAQTYWHGDQPVTLGEGYLKPNAEAGSTFPIPVTPFPLHFFNGVAVRPLTCKVLATVLDAHQRPQDTGRAAMTENQRSGGRCILIAPDITGTIIRIQQGTAIAGDHVPAPDGSAPISDGVPITEDAMTLDWIFDRQTVPGTDGMQAFTEPIADYWKEILLRTVLDVAREERVAVPMLWFYPRNLPAIGTLSHDSDGNDPAGAIRMLENLEKAKVHSTWCILLPGYTKDIIQRIKDGGHELATHYDAMTNFADWRQDKFNEQVDKLTALFDGPVPVTNKNHVLRWEGDTEFFGWLQAKGIQMDQSKGDCQTGEAGFLFGTCHPYRPVAPDGKVYDVLEQPTYTQDLIMTVPTAVGDMILKAACGHYGVAHFLFHPAHSTIPAVADAMLNVLAEGKKKGLEWWPARDISAWERARRTATWSAYTADEKDSHGKASVSLRTEQPLPDATILWLAPPEKSEANVDGKPQAAQTVKRWGFSFQVTTGDLLPGAAHELTLTW